jgi:hypothetical protein
MNARCCSEIDSQLHFTTLFFPQTDYWCDWLKSVYNNLNTLC